MIQMQAIALGGKVNYLTADEAESAAVVSLAPGATDGADRTGQL